MYNRNSPYEKLAIQPDYILEIRLKPEIWERIVGIAEMKKRSYSWVVRYCLFRFIKRKDPRKHIGYCTFLFKKGKFEKVHELAKQYPGLDDLHRHKLCLYGEDELFIRITAALMCCTMTHLVRMALEWNIDELEKETYIRLSRFRKGFHANAFYWMGIKLYEDVVLPTMGCKHKDFRLERFHQLDYW
ncbi:MAG: hypothetical protein ABUK01_06940 [Leptospirales bacterium]